MTSSAAPAYSKVKWGNVKSGSRGGQLSVLDEDRGVREEVVVARVVDVEVAVRDPVDVLGGADDGQRLEGVLEPRVVARADLVIRRRHAGVEQEGAGGVGDREAADRDRLALQGVVGRPDEVAVVDALDLTGGEACHVAAMLPIRSGADPPNGQDRRGAQRPREQDPEAEEGHWAATGPGDRHGGIRQADRG